MRSRHPASEARRSDKNAINAEVDEKFNYVRLIHLQRFALLSCVSLPTRQIADKPGPSQELGTKAGSQRGAVVRVTLQGRGAEVGRFEFACTT